MEMNTSDSERIHVRISDPSHPHYPEIGYLTGKVIKLFGEPMGRIATERLPARRRCMFLFPKDK